MDYLALVVMLNSELFKTAGVKDFEEMEDYLLSNGFESTPSSRATAQYQQFISTDVPEIKINWKTVPFVIAIHPETGKFYIPGTARYGQGLSALQRVVKKFTQEDAPVETVAPLDDANAAEEMDRLVAFSEIQNSALEPRGSGSRRENYRDINNTHNRSLRFLNKALQDNGFGDYEVWKGEKHMGSNKETYLRYNPLRSSFGQTPKGYERTPKYHAYTRYAGDYGMVEPADLAAMIACHRGYDARFPEKFQEIMGRTRMSSDPSWYKWSVNPKPKMGSLKSVNADVPTNQKDALETKTEQMVPEEHEERLGGKTVPTEVPNQNAVREAIDTAAEMEVGKTIEEAEGGSGEKSGVTVKTTPSQIVINLGGR